MCGIVAINGDIPKDSFNRMVERIHHRGPDHHATYSDGNVHLGHTRLSVIDLSSNSNQPLWDIKRQACIVFNGEIYNYKVLRDELIALGYTFHSAGDSEVIVNLYLHYGIDCLEKLNGIFSFAIWDVKTAQLIVARDPFGVKPLYFTENRDGFYCASELKSLLQIPGLSKQYNYDALLRSIVFLWSPGPETVLQGLSKLEPGHYLIVKNQAIVKHLPYVTSPAYAPKPWDVQTATQQLEETMLTSVKSQLVADVPMGAFLSGGLDSSLIVSMAKKLGVDDLSCFTIDINQWGRHEGFTDDLPYAKQVAKYLKVALNTVEVDANIVDLLSKMIYHLDEPQADPAPLNVWYIAEMARQKGIKVLLSGAGGDDLFTGYRRHHAIQLERYWSGLPSVLKGALQMLARRLPKNNAMLRRFSKCFAYATAEPNERILSYFYWLNPNTARKLFTPEAQSHMSDNPMQRYLSELDGLGDIPPLEKMLHFERRYFLTDHNFNYTDKMSMAHGVEVRVPFLDPALLKLASEMPVSMKRRGKETKWILKKMAENYLPHDTIYRSKTGFGGPLRHWIRNDLKPLVHDVLGEERLRQRGLFNPQAVQYLIHQNDLGKQDYTYPIFALLCIELWSSVFMDVA